MTSDDPAATRRRPARQPDGLPCDQWRGPKEWFQYESRMANVAARHDSWMIVECATPRCLTHTVVAELKPLDYIPGVCVYCGLSSNATEHIPASDLAVWTLPACRECIAGATERPTTIIADRRALAHRHIRDVHAKYLALKVWTVAELDEMGPNLRSVVEPGQEIGNVVRARLAWPPDGYDDAAMRALDTARRR